MRRVLFFILFALLSLSPPRLDAALVVETPGAKCTDGADNERDTTRDTGDADCTAPAAWSAEDTGYAAEAEDCIRSDSWVTVADTTASGGEYVMVPFGGQPFKGELACHGLPAGTYYLWAGVEILSPQAAEMWVKAGATGFEGPPTNIEGTKLNSGQVTSGIVPVQIGRYDVIADASGAGYRHGVNTTPQRTITVAASEFVFLQAQQDLRIDWLYADVSPSATPKPPTGVAAPVANYQVKELGTNTVTADGILDGFVGQANQVPFTGTGTLQATWVMRFAYDTDLNRLHFWASATLADLVASVGAAEDDSAILSDPRVEFVFKFENLSRVRDEDWYKVACNSAGFLYEANYPLNVSTKTYDFPSTSCLTTYTGNVITYEGFIEPEEPLTDGNFFLFNALISERTTGDPETFQFAFGNSVNLPSVAGIGKFEGTMATPADGTQPAIPTTAEANITSNSCSVVSTGSDNVSTVMQSRVRYGTVTGGPYTLTSSTVNTTGTCTSSCTATNALTGLSAGIQYFYLVDHTDAAGNLRTSAEDSCTTTSALTDLWLAPTGSDAGANNCETEGSPCKTFTYVQSKLNLGTDRRRITLKDGTYTQTTTGLPNINCATGGNAISGTAAKPITIRAQNERAAFLDQTTFATRAFVMDNCQFWIIEGLRMEGGDFDPGGSLSTFASFSLGESHNLIFRRNVARFNNREINSSLFATGELASNNLFEDNEFYSFHRNGPTFGTNGIVRRNYIHSRCHADLPGRSSNASCSNTTCSVTNDCGGQGGDDAIISYTQDNRNSIWENNIAERSDGGFAIIAADDKLDLQVLGNISYQNDICFGVFARGSGANRSPLRTFLENNIAWGCRGIGFNNKGAKFSLYRNNTSWTTLAGAGLDNEVANTDDPGSGPPYTVEVENHLSLNNSGTGIGFNTAVNDYPSGNFTVKNSTSQGNGTNFRPSGDPGYSGTNSTNPSLANPLCIPRNNATLAGTGLSGKDRGANVIYRYENGVQTTLPLWVPFSSLPARTQATCPTNTSGWYLYNQGACIDGVNKGSGFTGNSLYNLADRLGITTAILNSCAPDGSY